MKKELIRTLFITVLISFYVSCSKESNNSQLEDKGFIKLKMNGMEWECNNAFFQILNLPSPNTLVTVGHYDLDDTDDISIQQDGFEGKLGKNTLSRLLFEYKDSSYIATNIPYTITSYSNTRIIGTVDNIVFEPNDPVNLNSGLPYKSKLILSNISFSIPKQ